MTCMGEEHASDVGHGGVPQVGIVAAVVVGRAGAAHLMSGAGSGAAAAGGRPAALDCCTS
jgi:hypothetical protein